VVGCSGRGELACLLFVVVFLVIVEDRLQRVVAKVAVADEPFVVLFDDDAGGEPDQGAVVGEDADDVGAASDLAVDSFERVGRAQLRLVRDREGVEGEQVVLGFFEQRGDLRQRFAQPFERVADELARLLAGFGVEDRP
jgi:hypothetical protein